MKTQSKIAIIGGGPAGLIAAERLASPETAITVYDRMQSVGRKFLMAGHGGLNITHSEPLENLIGRYGSAAEWLAPAIKAFTPEDLLKWCASLGIETFVGSSGRVFPKEMKATPLLRAWLQRLDSLGVKFAPRHTWNGWNESGDLIFTDATGQKNAVKADATVLALGGASWPRLGSNGAWVDILQSHEIKVSPLRPANCGFIAPWSGIFSEKFAGQPLKPAIFTFGDRSLQGEAMITRQGLEGGAIYALSGAMREEIAEKGEAYLTIDLRPGSTLEKLTHELSAPRGSKSSSTFLRRAGLSPVAIGLMRESMGKEALPTSPAELAKLAKATKIRLTSTASLERAISSAGGITRDEIDTNFMLKKKPGVFVAGEMLDWDAPTGGYLLQACLSTGIAAAEGAKGLLKIKTTN